MSCAGAARGTIGPVKTSMRRRRRRGVVRVALAVVLSAASWTVLAANAPEVAKHLPQPVVLELFTSQGCSSCPDADVLLSRLGLEAQTRSQVAPLAFHVDYWNDGGWIDPFSARPWTLRQQTYGRALRLTGAYTPQLVVGGQAQFVGGDEARARTEIAAALERKPVASIGLVVRKAASGAELAADVTAEMIESVRVGKLVALVALFESGLVTNVARGENAGRSLPADFVVRRLESAFSLEPKVAAHAQRSLMLKLDPAWNLANLGVAVFLQDPGTMRIYGAAVEHVH
jgi:hypothetical protein